MKPVNRPKALELAANSLRAELMGQRLAGRLPGARVLSRHLGVSPPTVAAALRHLATEGLLVRDGRRKAYRVAETIGQVVSPGRMNRLLIVTHEDPGLLPESSRRTLETLRLRMIRKGWQVDWQIVDFMHVKRPQRSWDRLIQIDEGTHVIALWGREALAKWALARQVRILFLGGISGGLPVPVLGVRSSEMLERALARLTALGHWKVVIPLCDRGEPFKKTIHEVTRKAIEGTGHDYVGHYHNPESGYLTPEVTERLIESSFSALPPTALVFLDWKELVTAHCVLVDMGLRVPKDVSLVLLNDQMEAAWFRPTLCRFRIPESLIVRKLVAWLEGRLKPDHQNPTVLTAEYIDGMTIGSPRA